MIIGFYLAASQLNTRGGTNAPGYYIQVNIIGRYNYFIMITLLPSIL